MSAKNVSSPAPGAWKDRSEWLTKAREHIQEGEAIVKMANIKMRDASANELLKFFVRIPSIFYIGHSTDYDLF